MPSHSIKGLDYRIGSAGGFDILYLSSAVALNFLRRKQSLPATSSPSTMLSSPKRVGSERGTRAKEQAKQLADAKAVSDQIDAMLDAERAALQKHSSVIRILLLGMPPACFTLKLPLIDPVAFQAKASLVSLSFKYPSNRFSQLQFF